MLAFCILKAYNLIFLLMDFSRFVLIDHFLGESSKSTLSENTEETLAFMISSFESILLSSSSSSKFSVEVCLHKIKYVPQ